MKPRRVAIGQISSESNHFTRGSADIDFFRNTGYLREGDAVLSLSDSDTEVGGFISECRRDGNVELVPLLVTRGNSGPVLTSDCWREFKDRMLRAIVSASPVDAVLLSHHGSMCAQNEDDPEGDMIASLRGALGPHVPVVVTLDLHGNVTASMVEHATALVGYEHYPHDDAKRTGERAARLALDTLAGRIAPVMAHAKLPMMLTGFNASTQGHGPFARLMQQAKALEKRRGVLSTSLFCVGSYIDVPDIGCSAVVIADRDAELASRHTLGLMDLWWRTRDEFLVPTMSLAAAVAAGRKVNGPVLLLDTADTTGGGAAGDSIALVKELLAAGVAEPCIAMVIDPEVAQRCATMRPGAAIDTTIGHKIDPQWGKPLRLSATLVRTTDGRFRYSGGVFGGTEASMGKSAVLRIGSIELLVMSHPTYDWAYEQYASVGLDPRRAKFVGVKNMMNFRQGYAGIAAASYPVRLPGPTPIDYRALPFKRIRRPMYPFDPIATMPEPVVTVSGTHRAAR